jgi:hypothetical protein
VLAHELLPRLEEVDVQAGEPIDAPELGIGGLGGEAIIADELAPDGPVLLLDVGAVVLLPGAAAGEGDPALPLGEGADGAIAPSAPAAGGAAGGSPPCGAGR